MNQANRAQFALACKQARMKRWHRWLQQLLCFWTWPFGHIWQQYDGMTSYERQCWICGKKSSRGNYDPDWKYDLAATTEDK